ncbi:MAG TPA: transposase family protein [Trichocoleus sp.]|jgi:putative transposase
MQEGIHTGANQEYLLLNELPAEAQRKVEWANKIRATGTLNRAARQQLIQEAAQDLNCHPRTIKRMMEAVERDGLIALSQTTRSDKGSSRYISEPWRRLVIALYRRNQKYSRRTNRFQIWLLIKAISTKLKAVQDLSDNQLRTLFDGIAQKLGSVDESHSSVLNRILKEIREEVASGKFSPPRSHVSVYNILDVYIEEQNLKARHPGQGLNKVIQTTEGNLAVTPSNKVIQIDHTRLDVLVVDQEGHEIGCPFLSVATDSYSGCIAGFYLGFRQPSSLEVALVLRHAILRKEYSSEYKLKEKWNVCGIPDYLLTDRAKEFKSEHLQQIAAHLGFTLRYRAYPEQGGIVESVFDKLNKEFNSRLPGYKGSNVAKRPKDAEKYASITIEELERQLVRHFVDHVNQHCYPGTAEKRCDRWESMHIEFPKVPEERELDICLLKQNKRPKVQKHGTISFEGELYKGDCLLEYVKKKVVVRYDPSNIIHLLVYTHEEDGQPGRFLGVVRARDLKEDKLSLKELKERKRRLSQAQRAIDISSILDERLDLNEFAEEKIKKTRKQRRSIEHELTGCSSGLANVVEFKRQEALNNSSEVAVDSSRIEAQNSQRKRFKPSDEAKMAIPNWNQHLQDYW